MADYKRYVAEREMDKYGVAWFSFDEDNGNVTDAKGTSTGTLSNATRVQGISGNALNFNGMNSFVTFDQKVIPVGKKSIRFRIKVESIPSTNQYVLGNVDSFANNNGIAFNITTTGLISVGIGQSSSTPIFQVSSKSVVVDNEWHDILLMWDGTTDENKVKLYVDDMENPDATTTAVAQETESPTNNLILGRLGINGGLYFKGQLDELEIYNDIINPLESKYILVESNNEYYTYNEVDGVVKVDITELSEEIFEQYGMTPGYFNSLDKQVFSSLISPNEIYWDYDSSGTYDEKDKISYRVLVNDNEIQPFSAFSSAPLLVSTTILNKNFNVGDNIVKVEFKDDFDGEIGSFESLVTLLNTAPFATVTMTPLSVYRENSTILANLSDNEADKISYRILINGVQKYPETGFTEPDESPLNIEYTVSNKDLKIGENEITIEYKDDFRESAAGTWTGKIEKFNNAPNIKLARLDGLRLTLQAIDEDNDKLAYSINLNGEKVFPKNDNEYTDLNKGPIDAEIVLEKSKVLIDKNNVVTVNVKDEYDEIKSIKINFIGEYSGIMFINENGSFYSTDVGDILRSLDFGLIISGQTSMPQVVYIQNKNPFNIKNILLSKSITSIPTGVELQISRTETPFVPEDTIFLDGPFQFDEQTPFYVRIKTEKTAEPGFGIFDINVKADPVK